MTGQQYLEGSVALVTGASHGLGRIFATDLARQGAAIGFLARDETALNDAVRQVQDLGGRAIAVPADITEKAAVGIAVEAIQDAFGPIDLLVNAAGACMPAVGETWMLDIDTWWRVFEINVKGAQICSNAVLPRMIERRRGRIIHLASSTVLHSRPLMSAYVASKTALVKLCEIQAAELRPHGIAVFAVHPGTVRTGMSEGLLATGLFPWLQEIFDRKLDDLPGAGSSLVAYLASGQADPLSGCYFPVPLSPEIIVQHSPEVLRDALQVLRVRLLPEAKDVITRSVPSLGM